MKKFIRLITILAIICFTFSILGAALAGQLPEDQEAQQVEQQDWQQVEQQEEQLADPQVPATVTGQPSDDGIKVVLNGRMLSFDVPPIIENGRTLVPLRVIFEALGATVEWDGATETVTATKGDTTIKLVIGGMAYKNDQPVTLDVPAKIVNGRTLVPVRFVSESLGAVVSWDGATSTVAINDAGQAGGGLASETGGAYTYIVFLNGSDLESMQDEDGSLSGAASADLNEMMQVGSNEKLNIVVETGGTNNWANEKISNTESQRWLVKNGDIEQVSSGLGNRNMGNPATLTDFIVWAVNTYPAEKYVLNLWDHGGGAHGGYAVDELHDFDGLTLDEIQKALTDAYSKTGKKFEIIGFDACLMATIETAYVVSPFANYFVASEETEPGHGWNYTPIMQAIVDNPSISGSELGKVIADGFKSQGEASGTADECTLSVTDLSKVAGVVEALNAFVAKAGPDINVPESFNKFAGARSKAEDYGNSGGAHGDSTDMVDIVDLAKQSRELYPAEADNLINQVNNAVVYKLPGCKTKPEANGLTVYLPFRDKDGIDEKMAKYEKIDFSKQYKDFVRNVAQKVKADATPVALENKNPQTGTSELFEVKIKQEDINDVYEIYSVLGIFAEDSTSKVLFLGIDNDISFDEQTGIVQDNFTGEWVTLGGHFVSMFLVNQMDEYSEYTIPAILNGEEVDIIVLYDYNSGDCIIVGARRPINPQTGMADKNIIKIKPGDKINPLFYYYDESTDTDGFEAGEEITVPSDINEFELSSQPLPKGDYLYGFYVLDYAQNESYSDFCEITVP